MASIRRLARRGIKKRIHYLQRVIKEMPILIDCSKVYGDMYYDQKMLDRMLVDLATAKQELVDFDKNNPAKSS